MLIRLCKHSLCRLNQNAVLGVVHHFLSHIYVADTGFCGSDVLSGNTQVVDGMLQTVLDSAQFAAAWWIRC